MGRRRKYDEPMKDQIVVRVTPKQLEKLSRLVTANDGSSVGDVVRSAIDSIPLNFDLKGGADAKR